MSPVPEVISFWILYWWFVDWSQFHFKTKSILDLFWLWLHLDYVMIAILIQIHINDPFKHDLIRIRIYMCFKEITWVDFNHYVCNIVVLLTRPHWGYWAHMIWSITYEYPHLIFSSETSSLHRFWYVYICYHLSSYEIFFFDFALIHMSPWSPSTRICHYLFWYLSIYIMNSGSFLIHASIFGLVSTHILIHMISIRVCHVSRFLYTLCLSFPVPDSIYKAYDQYVIKHCLQPLCLYLIIMYASNPYIYIWLISPLFDFVLNPMHLYMLISMLFCLVPNP